MARLTASLNGLRTSALPSLGISFVNWRAVLIFLGAAVMLLLGAALPLFPTHYSVLILLVPIALVLVLAMFVRPEWALIATVAYIPFESSQFRPLPLPSTLSVVKILGFLLLAAFFFHILFKRRGFRLLDDNQDFAVLLLGALMLFSGMTSVLPNKTLSSTVSIMRLFAFYFAVKNLVTSPTLMHQLMWGITASGTFASVFGLNAFFEERTARSHDVRVGGVYMDPNDFAAAMIMVVMVTLYLIQITKQRGLKVLLWVCVGFVATAQLLSASRDGLAALAVVTILYSWRQPHRLRHLLGLVLIVVISFPAWPQSVTDRLLPSSPSRRYELVKPASHNVSVKLLKALNAPTPKLHPR